MRGFRGSRAVQNQISRLDRNGYRQINDTNQNFHDESDRSAPRRPALPEWLKTPETKARELAEAQEAQVQQKAAAVPGPAAPASSIMPAPVAQAPKTVPHLRLVVDNTASARKHAAKPKAVAANKAGTSSGAKTAAKAKAVAKRPRAQAKRTKTGTPVKRKAA